jgi:hypothetical protein
MVEATEGVRGAGGARKLLADVTVNIPRRRVYYRYYLRRYGLSATAVGLSARARSGAFPGAEVAGGSASPAGVNRGRFVGYVTRGAPLPLLTPSPHPHPHPSSPPPLLTPPHPSSSPLFTPPHPSSSPLLLLLPTSHRQARERSTVLIHCTHTLYSYTILIHYTHTLYSCTLLMHRQVRERSVA